MVSAVMQCSCSGQRRPAYVVIRVEMTMMMMMFFLLRIVLTRRSSSRKVCLVGLVTKENKADSYQ